MGGRWWGRCGVTRPAHFGWVGTHTTCRGLGAAPVGLCFTSARLVFLLTLLGKLRQKGVCTGVAGEKEGGCVAVDPLGQSW